jgi:hypothetical protein
MGNQASTGRANKKMLEKKVKRSPLHDHLLRQRFAKCIDRYNSFCLFLGTWTFLGLSTSRANIAQLLFADI